MAELASRQHGVVARRQLDELNVSRRQVERAIERGELRALFRGVYLLGPFEPSHAREMAAVLACGPDSYLSHRTGTCRYELLPYRAQPGFIDVTVAKRNPGLYPGITVHRTLKLREADVAELDGIPITSPARTLIDFASGASDYELERAVAEAFARGLTNRAELLTAIGEAGRKRGIRRLRALLAGERGPKRTRSGPERGLLSIIRGAGLPEPQTNVKIGPWEVDFYWPDHGLVVEVDAYSTHSSPWAFERDRRKDAALTDRSLTVQRATRNQIRHEPELTVARIRRNLHRLTR